MKKIITPLAAFVSLVFLASVWLHLGPKFPLSGITVLLYASKGNIGAMIVAAIAVIGLILIPVSLILKNSARTFASVGLSVIAIILLLVFASMGADTATVQYPDATVGTGWYGSLVSFIIALIGAFLSFQPAKNDDGLSLNAEA